MEEFIEYTRIPGIGQPAPEFDVDTTLGRRSLGGYRGHWLILFSHPADFTPVCSSEFVAFADAYPEFQKLNCELLGLSIDSKFSHLAWVQNLEDEVGAEIPFPIIDDVSMAVSDAYGMLQPGASETATVRGVFVIDPVGIMRAILYYPISTGRSVSEILRLVRALQMTDEHGLASPEGWRPGENAIVPPPKTLDEARSQAHTARIRQDEGWHYRTWYWCERPVDAANEGDARSEAKSR